MNPMTRLQIQGTRVPLRKVPLRPDSDILTRTSWADAALALAQIRKGKATGNKASLSFRSWLQERLFLLGCLIQSNPGKIIFVGLLVLSVFCVGLKNPTRETDVEKLWVEDGGRLKKELEYTRQTLGEGMGSSDLFLIHTPKEEGANVLLPDTLLAHLHVLKAAVQVSVDVFDIPWSLKDMCSSPSFPVFEKHYIDMTLENLFPCAIITPLDCFWEGSKLLGPEYPVKIPPLNLNVQWTNLNPQWVVQTVKSFKNFISSSFPMSTIESFMKRAGITTAYQEKPCLQPSDENCPESAPNKKSLQHPDIGAELTGGCYGFATKYMHWQEDMLVGGVTKNKTGHIVRAEALQTILPLMAEKEMFEFWRDHMKVHNLDWNVDKAKKVLEAWQRKFTKVVMQESRALNISKRNTINVFSNTTLGDIMKDFSETNFKGIAVGCLAMLVYSGLSLAKFTDPVNSQFTLGCFGMLLVSLSVGAGFGFCGILQIGFNAATTQVAPFLALGMGLNSMFLIVHQYSLTCQSETISQEHLIGEILKRTGVNIALSSLSSVAAFFVAYLIPIPALRKFVIQTGILIAVNVGSVLLVFPAFVSMDIKRRRKRRIDLFCCFKRMEEAGDNDQPYLPLKHQPSNSIVIPIRQTVTHALPPDGRQVVTVLAPSVQQESWPSSMGTPASSVENVSIQGSLKNIQTKEPEAAMSCVPAVKYLNWPFLTFFLSQYLAPLLQKAAVKFVAVLLCICLVSVGIWGIFQVKDGLDLTDIVPRNTNEYEFLSQRAKYFGFFNMFAVTQGNFEYPTNQQLLYDYHDSFTRIERTIKNDNGGLPDFWLSRFRDWLLGLQKSFDEHWTSGCITQEGWCSNATDDGIMAFKLLVQTGRMDNPIDKSLVMTMRLVDKNGIINPKAFYNYLSAWVSNDALAYSTSQANFVPEPRRWIHDPQDYELKMPKSQPLVYAQMPFFLNRMAGTEEITDTVRAIRAICDKFVDRGLPNFPSGYPFTYWEQYINLRTHLMMALGVIFVAVFCVVATFLLNVWAAAVVVVILLVITVELWGFMGLIGIKLSAVPAVILVAAVGMGAEFAVHLLMGFLTSLGNRERRMVMAFEQMFSPVLNGAISTLIGVIMLLFSKFDFIYTYFFTVLCALVVIGLFNGFILFPILLSILGPPAEVIPVDNLDRLATPSPEASPLQQRVRDASGQHVPRRIYPRVPSEISLSTIQEESGSCQSPTTEILVEPEFTVETTTITNTGGDPITHVNMTSSSSENTDSSEDSSKCNTPCSEHISSTSNITRQPGGGTAVTTRVTATAKVKVEVHTPAANMDYYRYRKRRDSSSSRSSSARSSPT